MAYSEDMIRLTVAVDEITNEKLTRFAEIMQMSKTELVNTMIKNDMQHYLTVWNIIMDESKYKQLLLIYKKKGLDTSELLKIRKKIKNNPRLVAEATNFFELIKK